MAAAPSPGAEVKLKFGSWKKNDIGGTLPSTRYSHATTLQDGVVYLFGGASNDCGNTTYYDDLFALNLSSSPLEWQPIQQVGSIPSAREGANFKAVGKMIYLHGGIDSEKSKVCAEGLYAFTPASATWDKIICTGPAPTAQSSSAVAYEKKIIVFGGIISGKAQNCLHSLNLTTLEWTAIESTGPKPPPRCDHLAIMFKGKMLVSAGSGSEVLWYNDIHVLEIGAWQWTQVELKGKEGPSPRDYSAFSTVSNKYLLQFGGFSAASGDEQCFADLYWATSDQDGIQWHKASPTGSLLPARYAHSTVFHKNVLYVFGGQNMEEEFNDVWSISVEVPAPPVHFEPTPVPRVRYTTNTPIPSPRKIITPAPPATVKPRDIEELRTKYLKSMSELFDTLIDRFQQLDLANATLESEKAAFDAEKKAHSELYEKQQKELEEMLKTHKEQNEEWMERMRGELDEERKTLAEQKAAAEAASADLAAQQEAFQQKSKKLDFIMRQVQGLKD